VETQRDIILVTGAAGFLGWHLVRRLEREEIPVVATIHKVDAEFVRADVRRVELSSVKPVERLLEVMRPAAIVHTAALTQTGVCEEKPEAATRANVEATQVLLDAAAGLARDNIPLPYLILTSTDLVFDGESAPYDENSQTWPIIHYGKTKLAAEEVVKSYPGPWTILRPALMYGAPTPYRSSFLEWIRTPLREGREVTLFVDEWRTPVLVDDVVEAILRLLHKPQAGVFHCGGTQRLSRKEMGEAIARAYGLPAAKIRPARRADVDLSCPRPRDVSLISARIAAALGLRLVGFEEGLQRVP